MTGTDTLSKAVTRPISHDVTSHDSSLVFLVKALLFPVTTVAFLLLCLWIWQRPVAGPYFLIGVIGFAAVGELLDLSKIDYLISAKSALRALRYIFVRWLALDIGILAVMHLSRMELARTDPPLVAWLLLTPLVLLGVHLLVWFMLLRLGAKHLPQRNAVIVGLTTHGRQLQHMLQAQPLLGIRCLGVFDDAPAPSAAADAAGLLGASDDLLAFVRENHVQLVYITLPLARNERLLKLLDALHDSVASVYLVPDVFELSMNDARMEVVHGVPLIALCESPFYGVHGVVKRASDVLLAMLILVLISPVLIAVAIGVKRSSPGPVLFKQRRYGLDGREIMVYKFRSMTVTEDGATTYQQVTRTDPRVTRFGRFIRRTSLDELPQFFNVLEGTMSVVGPRPHAVAVNERYRLQIPAYMVRHKIKPGITGWAQVNGFRGGDDLPTMEKRIEFDLNYLSNWSLLFDLKIIVRTVTVVLKDVHAF